MAHSADCKILVISPRPEHAQHFVQRVQTLKGENGASSLTPDTASNIIPWTIANKYYTADVHFETRVLNDFRASHANDVPAVVYVWKHGEPFREHILDISNSLRDHDPDVSLAVRFGGTNATDLNEEDGTDEFLSSHGFEYIEGDRSYRRSTQDEDRISEDEDAGIPGLPRVVDALSTIMWPSIVQSESTRNRKSRARELLDWARGEEEDDGLRALISDSVGAGGSAGDLTAHDGPVRKSRMQREMEELESWLEEEDRRREMEDARAWFTTEQDLGNADGWQDMPTPTIKTPTADESGYGFDDDFTEFVSAPSHRSLGALEADHLVPMHTGASYRSLASVSDFAGEGELFTSEPDEDEDAEDPDLPSRAEIRETSRRIFGVSGPLPDVDISRPSDDHADEHHSFDHHDDDDEFEMSAFDLSRVLSALQGMKEEISGMEDESERRKAAARVALGLVYGLQADKQDE